VWRASILVFSSSPLSFNILRGCTPRPLDLFEDLLSIQNFNNLHFEINFQ
jgi:hypothetical protein